MNITTATVATTITTTTTTNYSSNNDNKGHHYCYCYSYCYCYCYCYYIPLQPQASNNQASAMQQGFMQQGFRDDMKLINALNLAPSEGCYSGNDWQGRRAKASTKQEVVIGKRKIKKARPPIDKGEVEKTRSILTWNEHGWADHSSRGGRKEIGKGGSSGSHGQHSEE
jgi:hypothetical protein